MPRERANVQSARATLGRSEATGTRRLQHPGAAPPDRFLVRDPCPLRARAPLARSMHHPISLDTGLEDVSG